MYNRPYRTRDEAAYWGGGAIIEANGGGYWSLHGVSTPVEPYLTHSGRDGTSQGWPPEAAGKYVWGRPDGESRSQICRVASCGS